MAEYKGIKGYKVQSLASDPTLVAGQTWFNTAGNALKYLVNLGAWSSGGTMTRTSGQRNIGAAGVITAVIAAGGYQPASVGFSETYNGSTWTAANPLTTPRAEPGMAGTTTAAIAMTGGTDSTPYETGAVETYDGTSWTEVTDITTTRGTGFGSGTQTAALYYGGNIGGPPWAKLNNVEEWNGSAWSEKADMNAGRNYGCQASSGSVTASIASCGNGPTAQTKLCETYNGTSWTEVNNTNTQRVYGGGFGTSTSAMAYGGEIPSQTANAEQWNGTCWTEVDNLSAATANPGGSGASGTTGICIAGANPSDTSTCEEWAFGNTVKTVTVS